ncbi:hypothetical protein [Pseudarthrobacter sp. ATCC 49987]|nr:hypothetical protein [Pseudarthrobacter sp. ATCC 49987]
MATYYSQISRGLDDEIDMSEQLIEQEERAQQEERYLEYSE